MDEHEEGVRAVGSQPIQRSREDLLEMPATVVKPAKPLVEPEPAVHPHAIGKRGGSVTVPPNAADE
jgi:hypothetical protein